MADFTPKDLDKLLEKMSKMDSSPDRGDMSNDPITYTSDRIKTLNAKIAELPEIFLTDGETSTEFRSNFYRLTTEKGRFLDGVSRLIGGVYSN